MRVTLADAALDDLKAIGTFISGENSRRAETFVAELAQRCDRLGSMPSAYPLVPRHEASDIRRCPFRDYLIFYRVLSDVVEVLRVIHGARDFERLLFPE